MCKLLFRYLSNVLQGDKKYRRINSSLWFYVLSHFYGCPERKMTINNTQIILNSYFDDMTIKLLEVNISFSVENGSNLKWKIKHFIILVIEKKIFFSILYDWKILVEKNLFLKRKDKRQNRKSRTKEKKFFFQILYEIIIMMIKD